MTTEEQLLAASEELDMIAERCNCICHRSGAVPSPGHLIDGCCYPSRRQAALICTIVDEHHPTETRTFDERGREVPVRFCIADGHNLKHGPCTTISALSTFVGAPPLPG